MKIIQNSRNPGKFVVLPQMDFAELVHLLPLEAFIAKLEIGEDKVLTAEFEIFEGDLYAVIPDAFARQDQDIKQWWYFDNSVRRWSKCDSPKE